jgi:hypothetical protein
MSPHEPHLLFGWLGLGALVVCICLAQMRINRWRRAEGFSPDYGGNREYSKFIWHNMPAQVKRQARILQVIGIGLAAVGLWLSAWLRV